MITLSEIEKLRKNVKLLLILNIAIVVPAVPFWPSPLGIGLCVFATLMFLTVVMKKIFVYKKLFKDNIVRASLEGILEDLCYEPDKGISTEEIDASGLIVRGDTFTSNDLFVAKYGRVTFKQADFIITEERILVGENSTSTKMSTMCFTGKFLVFDLTKSLPVSIKVLGKKYHPDGDNWGLLKSLKKLIKGKPAHQIVTKSEVFNANFNIFCSDPETAFDVLTPSVINAISILSSHYDGKIALCYQDNKLFVVINTAKDSYEAKLFSNRTIWQEKELVIKDIKIIIEFIDRMNLENEAY